MRRRSLYQGHYLHLAVVSLIATSLTQRNSRVQSDFFVPIGQPRTCLKNCRPGGFIMHGNLAYGIPEGINQSCPGRV
ncbi:hypothetical protein EJ03DRAFT_217170 [Teratosphaeria nubilosa]|uniref:Uncharacterized protein n=1 Tax=Teratosphaeria nubilosa TaxID=161662 RepID=A0A6G1LI39_9PEZI|nr:hypothetical protein EJ03DRAFT_217170 [Teratosphaeria nubilosa]